MVPNLLSPHPFNALLLPLLRFRASSLSSPQREIGLMKLKGMGALTTLRIPVTLLDPPTPPLVATPVPQRCSLHTHIMAQFITQAQKIPITHITSEHIAVTLRAPKIQRQKKNRLIRSINEALDAIQINLLFGFEERICFKVKEEELNEIRRR